ncbi:flagellar export chaperone FliS [Colwellia sp. UCD-KL20]|uniref:flagellar export chaperone FliS n=1 Tax=Colwellia sp. UCD-KL20 TaxID=1917165 RepID=UPI0009702F0F|nr:flagellar export chaperone FliS [Colwellia sp. UCD-KL20]
MRQNLQAYKKVNIDSNILASDPHKIIVMMFDGVLQSMSQAKGAIERKDFALKSTSMTKSINILNALRNSLDFTSEPVISQRFDDLYAYCIDQLHGISVNLNAEGIDEVISLLKPLRDAWFDMPEESKKEGLSLLEERNKLTQGA